MRFCFPLTAAPRDQGTAETGAIDVGGKARSLLRLRAAGLPVPAAFVISGALFRTLRQGGPPLPARLGDAADLRALEATRAALLVAPFPGGFDAELSAALAVAEAATTGGTPTRWAVRSSFASEDQAGALAAGLFQSVTDVARAQIAGAVREVLTSALAPATLQYAARLDQSVDLLGMPVLIHPFTAGTAAGSAAWDPATTHAPVIDSADGAGLSTKARASIDDALRRLAAAHGPVEIEWVAAADNVIYLQLRPFQAPTPAPAWAGHTQLPSGKSGALWRWDAGHNPLPLSPAQAALIRLVDQRCRLPFRQAVAGGYLFYTPEAAAPALVPDQPLPSIRAQQDAAAAEVARDLATLGPAPTLAAALEIFLAHYQRIFGQLQPAAREARAALEAFLTEHAASDATVTASLLADVPSIASQRRAAATRLRRAHDGPERAAAIGDYLRDFGDETAIWDVAVPTFSEDPRLLPQASAAGSGDPPIDSPPRWRLTADETRHHLPEAARDHFDALLEGARDAVAAGELDDHLYARLQARVRRALQAEGARLAADGVLEAPDDIFWLSDPLAPRPVPLTRAKASAQLQATRAADQAARRAPPPRAASVDAARDSAFIRGKPGAGGRAVGRAFLYPDPGGAVPDGDAIIVATTLLPTELPLLDAAALIVETGGVLGHVAAQARERHLPAVVGATNACARIASGDQLLVDGDAGWVLKL